MLDKLMRGCESGDEERYLEACVVGQGERNDGEFTWTTDVSRLRVAAHWVKFPSCEL